MQILVMHAQYGTRNRKPRLFSEPWTPSRVKSALPQASFWLVPNTWLLIFNLVYICQLPQVPRLVKKYHLHMLFPILRGWKTLMTCRTLDLQSRFREWMIFYSRCPQITPFYRRSGWVSRIEWLALWKSLQSKDGARFIRWGGPPKKWVTPCKLRKWTCGLGL